MQFKKYVTWFRFQSMHIFQKKNEFDAMLYLYGCTQVMKVAETLKLEKCLDQHFVCHVDNQCYNSYTHPKNLKKTQVSGFSIYFVSLEAI